MNRTEGFCIFILFLETQRHKLLLPRPHRTHETFSFTVLGTCSMTVDNIVDTQTWIDTATQFKGRFF